MDKKSSGSRKRKNVPKVWSPPPDEQKDEPEQSSGLKKWLAVGLISIGLAAYLFYHQDVTEDGPLTLASHDESLKTFRSQNVVCDPEDQLPTFQGCSPKRCARYVTDSIISEEEARKLLEVAKKGLALGGSAGGASILDLHSGALSYNDSFVDVYKLLKSKNMQTVFTEEDFDLYKRVKQKIHATIASLFEIPRDKLFLTHPTFFSRLTSSEPVNLNDEYWHVHVDKYTYETFHYTSLVYLSTRTKDFEGGRFIFVDKRNVSVDPKLGRLSFFTSASENPHYVEKVTKGVRYALTVSFTCDPQHKIEQVNGVKI